MVTPTHVLDTDLFTLFRHGTEPLTSRVLAAPAGSVALSVTTVEEALAGWYSALRQARRTDELERVYDQLARTVIRLAQFPIFGYTRAAMAEFASLQKQKMNIGRNDLRIAAVALEHGAAVVTRNVRDFGRVPNLVVEDWSAPPAP